MWLCDEGPPCDKFKVLSSSVFRFLKHDPEFITEFVEMESVKNFTRIRNWRVPFRHNTRDGNLPIDYVVTF